MLLATIFFIVFLNGVSLGMFIFDAEWEDFSPAGYLLMGASLAFAGGIIAVFIGLTAVYNYLTKKRQ